MEYYEKSIAAMLLDLAADEFSNHSCNDMLLENTDSNRKFVEDMIREGDYPRDKPNISTDGKIIYVADWVVMRRCSQLLRR